MKKTIYIECTSGISGDMVLGAYLDLGISPDFLKAELDKLGVSGYRIEVEKTSHYGIAGTRCHVILMDAAGHHHDGEHGHHSHAHHGEHGHAHGDPAPGYDEGAAHHHHHRSYKDIVALIEGSTLN
ncbi:nickel insertion protein, partial [Eubacterium aggregans]